MRYQLPITTSYTANKLIKQLSIIQVKSCKNVVEMVMKPGKVLCCMFLLATLGVDPQKLARIKIQKVIMCMCSFN